MKAIITQSVIMFNYHQSGFIEFIVSTTYTKVEF